MLFGFDWLHRLAYELCLQIRNGERQIFSLSHTNWHAQHRNRRRSFHRAIQHRRSVRAPPIRRKQQPAIVRHRTLSFRTENIDMRRSDATRKENSDRTQTVEPSVDWWLDAGFEDNCSAFLHEWNSLSLGSDLRSWCANASNVASTCWSRLRTVRRNLHGNLAERDQSIEGTSRWSSDRRMKTTDGQFVDLEFSLRDG